MYVVFSKWCILIYAFWIKIIMRVTHTTHQCYWVQIHVNVCTVINADIFGVRLKWCLMTFFLFLYQMLEKHSTTQITFSWKITSYRLCNTQTELWNIPLRALQPQEHIWYLIITHDTLVAAKHPNEKTDLPLSCSLAGSPHLPTLSLCHTHKYSLLMAAVLILSLHSNSYLHRNIPGMPQHS